MLLKRIIPCLGDAGRRAHLLEGGLGMAVDIAPEGFQGFLARGDIGLDFHALDLPWSSLIRSVDEVA